MSDLKITLAFDYSTDTNFNPPIPPYVPVGVEILDPHNIDDMTNYFKTCGWFSIWGKELEGIDATQFGGMAFLGENWLYLRKAIGFVDSDFYADAHFVKQIEVKSNLKNGGNAVSPVVIAMNIDGVKLAFLLHKTADPNTRILLGDPCYKTKFYLQHARIPFPANATWATFPAWQKGCKTHEFALAVNQVNIKVELEVAESLSIGWLAVDNMQGGSTITNMGHDAESINPTAFFAHPSMLDNMRTYPPNSAIAHMVAWGAEQGYLAFDKEAEKVLKRKPKVDKKQALIEAQEIIEEFKTLLEQAPIDWRNGNVAFGVDEGEYYGKKFEEEEAVVINNWLQKYGGG